MRNLKTWLLSSPSIYHYVRQIATGGMPFEHWVDLYGLSDPHERVADIGCGPSDILRYLDDESRPAFYLGVDISERYLDMARKKARSLGLDAEFIRMDLGRLPNDPGVQSELIEALEKHRITRVLLLGVIHHISDEAALTTLGLAHDIVTVGSLITSDVVYLPGRRLNNLLCDWDRGEFVRDEASYDALVRTSPWPRCERAFTHPGFSFIQYIHYRLAKPPDPDSFDAQAESMTERTSSRRS